MKGKDKKAAPVKPTSGKSVDKDKAGKSTDKKPAGKDSKDKNAKSIKGTTNKNAVDPKEVEKSKLYFGLVLIN